MEVPQQFSSIFQFLSLNRQGCHPMSLCIPKDFPLRITEARVGAAEAISVQYRIEHRKWPAADVGAENAVLALVYVQHPAASVHMHGQMEQGSGWAEGAGFLGEFFLSC